VQLVPPVPIDHLQVAPMIETYILITFFFSAPATTEIYTLSLHDALPILTTWGKNEPAMIPPGPDNPLGTRALDLSAPGIRIHGTPDDASIGTHASHGCIRMHIPDSEDLFGRVDIGTPVIIAY